MSKAYFFHQLQERLRGLPYEEQQNIIQVYEDLFRQADENGKTEQEVIASLGYIPIPRPQSLPTRTGWKLMRTAENGFRAVLATIALGLFNLIFVLAPFIAVTAVLFSFSVVSVLFTFSIIWIIIGTGIPPSFTLLLEEIFSALFMTGLGVLMSIGLWKTNRGYIKLVKRYILMNLKLIKGE